MNIFERAARGQYRFPTPAGQINVERLFELPLEAPHRVASLEQTAQTIHAELEAQPVTSFVNPSTVADATKSQLECKLEIVKHVIATKQATLAAAQTRAANADKRKKILAALSSAEQRDLEKKTPAQLLKELEKIDSGDA